MDLTPPPPPTLLLLPPPAPAAPYDRLVLNSAYNPPITAALASAATRSRASRQPVLLLVAVTAPLLAIASRPFADDEASSPTNPARSVVRWSVAQSLLAGVYSVIAAVCAEQNIQTDMVGSATAVPQDGSVDARVVLVDHQRDRCYSRAFDGAFYTFNETAVLDLAGFATCVRGPWERILHPSCEAGYELVRAFLNLAEGKQCIEQNQVVAVPGGISIGIRTSADGDGGADSSDGRKTDDAAGHPLDKNYESVVLGGTFDHLHLGHKLLLHGAALLLRFPETPQPSSNQDASAKGSSGNRNCTLIIGVSGEPMLRNKKFADELESWDTRCRSVLSHLATVFNTSPVADAATTRGPPTGYRIERVKVGEENSSHDAVEMHGIFVDGTVLVRCTVLNDPFGPAVDEEPIGAICVSGETRGGGRAVNDRRAAKGWHALDSYEVDVLDTRGIAGPGDGDAVADDFTAKISSTAIRQRRAEVRAKAETRI